MSTGRMYRGLLAYLQHIYRQRILVIDGKYSSGDGLSITAMISGAVIIGEEHQLCSLDLFLNSRWPSDLNEDKKSALKRRTDLRR
jgi:hypothetical protein